jgi:EmrB/QacA subfamily drug resistance transporter
MHHSAAHQHHPSEPATRRSWLTLGIVALAQFMVILDVTVVNVALPSIQGSLHLSATQLQWVVTAYVLFTGGLMLFGGRLTDLAGRRLVFRTGLALFTLASLASGLAWSPTTLIVSRAVQGIGAAMLLPSALAIVTTAYEGRQRAAALAVWGALGSAGAAAGVLFGGVLTSALGWESVFFINVPVGLGLLLISAHLLEADGSRSLDLRHLDLAGAATLMGGLFSLVLAIEGTSTHGWTSPYSLGLGALATLLLAHFAVIERRATHPLVPPRTWRNGPLTTSAAVMLAASGILVGAFFLNTLYLQHVAGASALETGLAFLPLTLVILVGAHVASSVLAHFGSRWTVVTGLGLAAAGAWFLSGAPSDPGYAADLLPGYLLIGFGLGMTFVSASVAAMAEVRHDEAGLASGLMTTAHELGAALGVAVLGGIATAAGATDSVAGLVDGYGTGLLVAGGVAATVALAAAFAIPSVRPAAGAAHGMHG